MLFGLFQNAPVESDEDTATGTYADGAVGTPAADRSAYAEGRAFRRTAHERDYGRTRALMPAGAGLTA